MLTRQIIEWRDPRNSVPPPVGLVCLMVVSLGRPFDQPHECVIAALGKSGAIYLAGKDYPSHYEWGDVLRWVPCRDLLAEIGPPGEPFR